MLVKRCQLLFLQFSPTYFFSSIYFSFFFFSPNTSEEKLFYFPKATKVLLFGWGKNMKTKLKKNTYPCCSPIGFFGMAFRTKISKQIKMTGIKSSVRNPAKLLVFCFHIFQINNFNCTQKTLIELTTPSEQHWGIKFDFQGFCSHVFGYLLVIAL